MLAQRPLPQNFRVMTSNGNISLETMGTGTFEMRVTVIDDLLEELVIWVRELIPYTGENRSITEWVDESIRSGGAEELRELLGIELGDFQAIASGKIHGFRCGAYDEEYDEEIEYSNIEWQEVPQLESSEK